jgi:hypothetical protein
LGLSAAGMSACVQILWASGEGRGTLSLIVDAFTAQGTLILGRLNRRVGRSNFGATRTKSAGVLSPSATTALWSPSSMEMVFLNRKTPAGG